MKYKVGDRVRIRTDLIINTLYSEYYFVKEMDRYKGKVANIIGVDLYYYRIDIDNGKYVWTDDMLEFLTEEYKVGYMIKIIDAGYGAKGCDGCIGVVTNELNDNGNGFNTKNSFNVKIIGIDKFNNAKEGQIWSVSKDGKYELLKENKIYNIIDVLNMPKGTVLKCINNGEIVKVFKTCGYKSIYNIYNLHEEYELNEIIANYKFIDIDLEIDWDKIPRKTKVQVKDSENDIWENRYFIKQNQDGKFVASKLLHSDSYTGATVESESDTYNYCRINPDIEIKEEWLKIEI